MPGILGTLLAGAVVAGTVFLAARSLWRGRKSACGCEKCGGCAHSGACARTAPDADTDI